MNRKLDEALADFKKAWLTYENPDFIILEEEVATIFRQLKDDDLLRMMIQGVLETWPKAKSVLKEPFLLLTERATTVMVQNVIADAERLAKQGRVPATITVPIEDAEKIVGKGVLNPVATPRKPQ